jgi:hypothetical protein
MEAAEASDTAPKIEASAPPASDRNLLGVAGGVAGGAAAAATVVSENAAELAALVPLDTWGIVTFVFITAILVGVAVLLFTYGNIAEIAANFEKYRCNPIVIPFAGLFGRDPKENFNFCIGNLMNIQASGILAPVYSLLANFVTIFSTIANAMMSIREQFARFFVQVNGFIASVQDRMAAVLFQLRLTFLKMQTLMGRVYGTMYATMFMGISAMAAGTSLADNDLVKFLFEVAPCFEGSTRVRLANGQTVPISELRVGTKLSTGVVTSVFVFDGSRTPLVDLDGVRMSHTHYVEAPRAAAHGTAGHWVEAGDHPDARPTSTKLDRIFCLNVRGNKFVVEGNSGPMVVADYCESASQTAAIAARSMALKALNGHRALSEDAGGALGVGGAWTVELADGRWKRIDALQLGDVLKDSGRIYGLVKEHCTSVAPSQEKGEPPIAAAQLQWSDGRWASSKGVKVRGDGVVLYSLFTERCSALRIRYGPLERIVRDYLEAPLPEMQEPFEAALAPV